MQAGPFAQATALAEQIQLLLGHIMRASSNEFVREAAEMDLSFTQFKSIFCIGGAGEMTVKALAEELRVSEPAASRATEGLVKRGLVERRESAEDRRQRLLSLTPQGVDLRERALSARTAGVLDLVESLDPAERDTLAAALEPVVRRIAQ